MDDFSTLFSKKAKELKEERKFEESLKLLDKALEIKNEEKLEDFWFRRGVRHCELGEFEQSLQCFDNDMEKRGENYAVYFLKGKILFQLKRFAESVEYFNKAYEYHNTVRLQSSKKAIHLKKAKKFEKALMYIDVTKNENIDENFWYFKGLALFKLKKIDEAKLSFEKAYMLENNPKFLYEIAKCELFLDNSEKSVEILKKCCDSEPITKEKLRLDSDFLSLADDKNFRMLFEL